MTSSIAQKWRDSTVPLYNAYGPTEVSICATIKKVIPEGPVRSIGRPLKHVGVYIMDGNYRKQPSMVRGQICITGTGVMQGYLGNHTLTSGCIQSPDENDARERLYATGDIGFALPNGEIVCLGREDQQVKFHGYRIELQEVEQCFCSLPTVKNAVAFIDNQILVCIYTADTQLSDDEIYQYLCKRLPAYMIPGIFQYEMDLPMLVNGKPDRIKIKQCYQQNNKTRNSRQDEITKAIIDCWSKLFQQKNIDQNSNFFELGGDSLLIMQFIEAMDSQYPGSLKVADVFRLPIVSRLAAFIDDQR